MTLKTAGVTLLILSATVFGFAQSANDDATGPDPVEVKAQAERMIRESAAIIPTLSSAANRVNSYAELAELAWEVDEAVTWSMLAAAGEDVKRYLTQVDIEANSLEAARSVGSRRDRSREQRARTNLAFELRRNYVTALAGFAPDRARAFVAETAGLLTNADLRSRAERENRRLESAIVKKIAENDVGKALEIGTEKLKDGLSSEVASILGNIYKKDKAKGAEFGELVIDKLKSSGLEPTRVWIASRLFQMGLSAKDQTVPLFEKGAMRTLAAAIAAAILDPGSKYMSLPANVLNGIDEYSPGSASRITSAFEQRRAAREPKGVSAGNYSGSISTGGSERERREATRREARQYREDLGKLFDAVEDPEAEREARLEAIAAARDRILSVEDDRFKYTNLAALAGRAFRAGEKEEAESLIKEAERFTASSPKDRWDYSAMLTIANAYAVIDPDQSFAIIEDIAYRLNGVIDGYVRFSEYSGNGRTVENGELLLNRYSRQFTSYFDLPDDVVKGLAAEDLERYSNLPDRFDRPEMRAKTNLIIIDSLLKTLE